MKAMYIIFTVLHASYVISWQHPLYNLYEVCRSRLCSADFEKKSKWSGHRKKKYQGAGRSNRITENGDRIWGQ
jgi:hypothetical protein